jgi:8-oxo-dGTP pyrophosphatase MutT (NUDIX family)
MRFIRAMPLTTDSSLVQLLARHTPSDAKEREDLERMRAFATELPSPFSRSQATAHFTGSAVVVDPSGERLVLIHHGKLKRWLQPGGHAEAADGGSMEASALREAREETGCQVHLHPTAPRPLDVDIHTIPARKDEPEHLHLDVRYLVIAENPQALVHDPSESSGAQWLGWAEALERADEAPLRRLLEKARAAARRN